MSSLPSQVGLFPCQTQNTPMQVQNRTVCSALKPNSHLTVQRDPSLPPLVHPWITAFLGGVKIPHDPKPTQFFMNIIHNYDGEEKKLMSCYKNNRLLDSETQFSSTFSVVTA